MRKKRKYSAALCLAGLLGCMMPMSTMKAAEGAETPKTVSENDLDFMLQEDEVYENEEYSVQDDLENTVLSEQDAAADADLMLTEAQFYDAGGEGGVPISIADSAIQISFGGKDVTRNLGVEPEYKYVNNHDQSFTISVSTGSVSYYLDQDVSAGIKSEEQLGGVADWTGLPQNNNDQIVLDQDGQYVLYVKAESEDNQISYVRSVIVVVDATKPVISGIESGGTYSAGTVFQVKDANLETVHVNQNSVSPDGNGNYSVIAKSATEPSCEIKARDKAGNETTISVTVTETVREPGEGNTIPQSGAYSLKAGTPYHLDAGNWTVNGDGTVYSGGITFYVTEDRTYLFRKV